MDILLQKGFFLNKKEIEITHNGLKIKHRNLLGSKDYYIHFDDLGIKHLRVKSGMIWFFVVSIFFAFVALAVYASAVYGEDVEDGAVGLYFGLSALFFIIFVIFYKNVFYLAHPFNKFYNVEFLYNKPSKREFEEFLSEIKKRRNTFLNEKYGSLNKMLTYEHNYKNLMWLMDNDVILKDEFDKRLAILNELFTVSKQQIGFKLNEH